MFCEKCGLKINEGGKFCTGCGAPVKAENTSHQTQAVYSSTLTPEQMKANMAQGLAEQVLEDIHAGNRERPKTSEPPKKKNKLLLIAHISVLMMLVIYFVFGIIGNFNIGYFVGSTIPMIIILVIPPTVLNVFGRIKNNKIMILIAGILYIFSILGIPSAVLCFIAFAKMKKK